jgi:hypothetical protein
MSLRDAEKRLSRTATCRIVSFLSELDKEDKATVVEWFAEKKPAFWIARVASADGKSLNEKTLKRHLDGDCCCPAGTPHKGAYRVAK